MNGEIWRMYAKAFDTQVPCAKLGHTSCEVLALGAFLEIEFTVIGGYIFCKSTRW